MKKIISIVLLVLLVAAFCLGGCTKKTEVITIAHKDYTEQRITGQLLSVYLESKGFATEVNELAGTMICYTALKNDKITMYAEFTGSAYGAIFDQTEIIGVQETYDYVKNMSETKDGITWMDPLGWNNTYVLSVRTDTAEKYNLKTIDDLIAVAPDFILGCDKEFQNRADGLPGLKEAYPGLEFKEEVSMDQGLTYAALNDGKIDVNVSYSTDGRIAKFGLVNLEDNKNFFPPYYVTPILKIEYADAHPEVVAALLELSEKWSDEDMQKYNLLVDEGANARDVATQMLKDAGLI
ncbi:MAG: glycine/betaine ABC transporter substrate-binding protein [Firmicutes bacterium HGW-Firmicutes-2]|jgi:glycine betaine/choline ABC-type transport system substrate-binding protein|nr:MAG: glycine/betaine ABC transporter substrate-binding protein [Firmicutes bacterium HGW-Firmicutes-2]